MAERNLKLDTKAVHLGFEPDNTNDYSVVPPIGLAVSFLQQDPASFAGHLYTRQSNPTRSTLEKGIAVLEDSKYALCFSSGTSAISAVVQLLNNGDHMVSNNVIYGGTYQYFEKIISRANITTTYVDARNPDNVEKAIKKNTKLVFLESPSNPLNTIADIAKIAQIVRKHPGVILAVDNTFLTPYFQKPLALGAHVTAYSLTKYMNGHDDVCMGALCCNDTELYTKLKYLQNNAGLNPSPFDCYLVYRGLRTLPLRMQKHHKNSLEIARFLEAHPLVVKVNHPWLPSHPGHEVAKKQSSGHCGMIAFYVKGNKQQTIQVLKNLNLVNMAAGLGAVSTIVEIPAVMSHAPIPEEVRREVGISDNLIRLSVGIEDAEDLIADLDQALNSALK